MRHTFKKQDRLKNQKHIQDLFENGKSISNYPIRLVYKRMNFDEESCIKASFSVSKRRFKSAVKRNRIKRQIREAYRTNKNLLETYEDSYALMFLFTATRNFPYSQIEKCVQQILCSMQAKRCFKRKRRDQQ